MNVRRADMVRNEVVFGKVGRGENERIQLFEIYVGIELTLWDRNRSEYKRKRREGKTKNDS